MVYNVRWVGVLGFVVSGLAVFGIIFVLGVDWVWGRFCVLMG